MLVSLNISNIALITSCNLTLSEGLNILSGETGAGKSIIIDSLTFVLGDRADRTLIRSGESTATVQAVFEIDLDESIIEILRELDIEPESTLIIKRTMTAEGRNECRINGRIVTLGMLRKLTAHISDICGQHEHQSLSDSDSHIDLLDAFGGLLDRRDRIKEIYESLGELRNKLARLSAESAARIIPLSVQTGAFPQKAQ